MPEIVIPRPDTKSFFVKSWDAEDLMEIEANDADINKDILTWAKKMKWEGFVVVDPESTYGDRAFNFHGKAERPKECCKDKPTCEADFIVRWDPKNGIGEFGKGKKSGGVGSVALYLWDPKKKEEVYVCDMGGGLTDADVVKYANIKLYPMIWEIEFSEWTSKGALRFPVFLRPRPDKTLQECEISQRPAAEEETDG
jgi:ATP-dependent DNA ligase